MSFGILTLIFCIIVIITILLISSEKVDKDNIIGMFGVIIAILAIPISIVYIFDKYRGISDKQEEAVQKLGNLPL